MTDTLTEKELAARWKLTTRTLQGWRSKGLGPRFVRLGERSIFYRRDDVEAYEKASTVGQDEPWRDPVRRAAGAFDLLAKKATSPKARDTLTGLRDDLRALLS